jgi:hypothetical protein
MIAIEGELAVGRNRGNVSPGPRQMGYCLSDMPLMLTFDDGPDPSAVQSAAAQQRRLQLQAAERDPGSAEIRRKAVVDRIGLRE